VKSRNEKTRQSCSNQSYENIPNHSRCSGAFQPALLTAAEPAAGPADEPKTAAILTEQTNQLAAPRETPSGPTPKTAAPKVPSENATNLLRMNFRGASLDQVLNYLSEASGFIINLKPGVSVRGKVDVWSNDPLTRRKPGSARYGSGPKQIGRDPQRPDPHDCGSRRSQDSEYSGD